MQKIEQHILILKRQNVADGQAEAGLRVVVP